MNLTLINHACCKVSAKSLTLLFDPWVEGTAFNNGWDLLIKTPFTFDEIMQDVTHIWMSHEHPDHFSPAFLSQVAKSQYRDKVTVLFQKTRDHRVMNFCNSVGLKVVELEDGVATRLSSEVSVTCVVQDFYDSWLYITDGKTSILNLNDCHTRTESDLRKITNTVPTPTILLSQFSYASWKGGKDNAEFRAQAAAHKLETLAKQIRWIKPKYTLPFASLIYFSNQENSYLNDHVNTPAKASMVIGEAGSQPIVLFPGESWDTNSGARDNTLSLKSYAERYETLDQLPLRDAGTSCTLKDLQTAFNAYQSRIFQKNSRLLILLLSRFGIMKAFQPVILDLYDINLRLSVSIVDGIVELSPRGPNADVRMHSSSLLFIFKNEFGFDTLCVNGRFECGPAGFSKMTKAFAVGSLNAMGLSLSAKLLVDFKFILLLIGILNGVMSKLKQAERTPAISSAALARRDDLSKKKTDRELTKAK